MKKIGKIIGRTLEIVVSVIIFVVALPFFLLAILLIQFDSPGPIILGQERVGKDGKVFKLFKLRTMKKDADGCNPMHTQVNDPRFSKLCRLVRATTLDEIPQLFNVIIGNMSLIGPRPERPRIVKTYTSEQRKVLKYVPGCLGISQLAFREGVVVEKKLKLEVEYYSHSNFFLDMKLLFYTPYVILRDTFKKLNGNSNSGDRMKMVEKAFLNYRSKV